jgi:Baseplate J-like protein
MSGIESTPFVYTSRDFGRLRVDMINRLKTAIPEWEMNESSFEMILLELFAYVGDIINFSVDRMAAEAYLTTAVLRESILNLAALFGYTPAPQTAAKGSVVFTKVVGAGNVSIPAGTQIYAQESSSVNIIFEVDDWHTMTTDAETCAVTEGTSVRNEEVGRSTGAERQFFPLFNKNVIKDSVVVYTKDGHIDAVTNEPTLVEWTPVPRMFDAISTDRAFTTVLDEFGYTYIRFGDGVSGVIPAAGVPIIVNYRFGVGAAGNVGVGAVRSLVMGGDLMGKIASVTNPAPMTGGSDPETIESMRRNIPRSLRALERAVTLEDHESLAIDVGGIAKASAAASTASSVLLAIAPFGVTSAAVVGGPVASTELKDEVDKYVSDRTMIGTTVTIIDPIYVPIYITFAIEVNPRARRKTVVNNVKKVVERMLAFDSVEFGQRVTRGPFFHEVVDVSGVDYVEITALNRDGAGEDDPIQLAYNEIPKAFTNADPPVSTITINATGGITPL